MPSVELVLHPDDRAALSQEIDRLGLHVLHNRRYPSPDVRPESPEALLLLDRASVYLTKSEWIFDPLRVDRRTNTVDGTIYYDLKPRVNFAALSLSFYLAEVEVKHRLGWGELDFYPTWLSGRDLEIRKSSPDVGTAYRTLLRNLQNGGQQFKGPNGRVVVMRAALSRYLERGYLMPHAWLEAISREKLLGYKAGLQ